MKLFNKPQFWIATVAIILFLLYKSYLKRNPYEKDLDYQEDLVDEVEDIIEKPVSAFLGNQLENGASPYDVIYQKGIYHNTKNSLTINNTSNLDVVVLLVENNFQKIYRNEYIRAGETFIMSRVPNSTFYTKYYYGKNWNPERVLKGQVVGGFDDNEFFSVSDEISDLITFQQYVEGDYEYYSQFEITLETYEVEGRAMSEEELNANEFFGSSIN